MTLQVKKSKRIAKISGQKTAKRSNQVPGNQVAAYLRICTRAAAQADKESTKAAAKAPLTAAKTAKIAVKIETIAAKLRATKFSNNIAFNILEVIHITTIQ